MLASHLMNTGFPSVCVLDKISYTLQLMDDYDVQHLPVVNSNKYVGIISKDDLLDGHENDSLANWEGDFLQVSVQGEEHFLTALKLMSENELSILAVINEQLELTGVLLLKDLIQSLSKFLGTETPGGMIVMEISKQKFSFGEICRLVETNDAGITQLNTYAEGDTGQIVVTLKINKIEVSDIVATFQRYDYVVRYYFGEEEYGNELKENYNHLIAYLNM